MSKEPINIHRLFLISKKFLNFSRKDFFESTFKEITNLLEELYLMNKDDDEEKTIEKVVSIENIPFL